MYVAIIGNRIRTFFFMYILYIEDAALFVWGMHIIIATIIVLMSILF